MPFNKETARLAGKKSKRGKAKKLDPTIKEKMEILYEEVLDHLIMHQKELSNSDRVRLVQSLSNYLLPKTKSVRDDFTLEKLKEIKKEGYFTDTPDPTK
jgi:hypothetical protein